MRIATLGNVRTAQAAKESISKTFRVAFDIHWCSNGIWSYWLYGNPWTHCTLLFFTGSYPGMEKHILMEALAGFGLGGSSVALFARVGGGIYTKPQDLTLVLT